MDIFHPDQKWKSDSNVDKTPATLKMVRKKVELRG